MKQVSAKQVSQALSSIDSCFILEAENYQSRTSPTFAYIAACLALVLCLVFAFAYPGHQATVPKPPVYENALFSADEVGALFAGNYDSTQNYQKVYAPSLALLDIGAVPSSEYLDIYQETPVTKDLDQAEFFRFADGIQSRLAAALGREPETYSILHEDHNVIRTRISADGDAYGQYSGRHTQPQSSARQYFELSSQDNAPLVLNGQTVQVDPSLSNEEILAAFTGIRDSLFLIVGENFDAAKIIRSYGSSGLYSIQILYYHASDPLLLGNTIYISFRNNSESDCLQECSIIRYTQYRVPVENTWSSAASCRMISLEDAYILLQNGYTFGGSGCNLCMQQQNAVDFTQYDAVGFEYYRRTTQIIPFYTFYKDIGESDNGNRIYAKTYVCAIELSGMDEYFAAQHQKH